MKSHKIIFATLLFCVVSSSVFADKFKTKSKEFYRTQNKDKQERLRIRYLRINTMVGVQVLDGSALNIGMQFAARVNKRGWYMGPELSYALYAPSSLTYIMLGGWREFGSLEADKIGYSIGAVGGVAEPREVLTISKTTYAFFLDFALSQGIDDLSVIRGQFRPGIIGGKLVFVMNFNVAFKL